MYEEVIKYYGKEAQHRQAMEEAGEFIQAVNKVLRNPCEDTRSHLIEEIADLSILIDQLEEMHNITRKEVIACRMFKENRLFKIVERGKKDD